MRINRLKEYLSEQKVKYASTSHSAAFTALEIAASAHIKGIELAKTVIVALDGKMTMCMLPTSHRIDVALLKESTDSADASLVPEQDYQDRFSDCDPGAQPPFGNVYDMPLFV